MKPHVVKIDGIGLYAHSLIPMGKEAAVEEIAAHIAPEGTKAERTAWAGKAWTTMNDEVSKKKEAEEKAAKEAEAAKLKAEEKSKKVEKAEAKIAGAETPSPGSPSL